MKLVLYQTAQEFLDDYEAILLEEEAKHQLLIGNLYHFKEQAALSKDNIFGVVVDKKKIHLFFVNAFPYNIQVYSPTKSKNAFNLLAKHILSDHILYTGVNGSFEDTNLFITAMEQENPKISFFQHLAMDIMVSDSACKRYKRDLTFQLGKQEDMQIIWEYMIGFHQDCFLEPADREKIKTIVEDTIKAKRQYILKNSNNEILTIAMVSKRRLVNGACISGVYTPPKYRSLGYSTFLMQELTNLLFKKGHKFVTLFVDKSNPVSNKVYEKVGYKIIQNNYDYRKKEAPNE